MRSNPNTRAALSLARQLRFIPPKRTLKETTMELTSWIVLWVAATAIAVVLGYYRMTLGLHDEIGMRIGSSEQTEFYRRQKSVQHKIMRLDRYGIGFTVASAILAVVVVLVWAFESGGRS
jgi:hypothetical protein